METECGMEYAIPCAMVYGKVYETATEYGTVYAMLCAMLYGRASR